MTTTTHRRTVHIDAPVEKVFDHVQDPRNFFAAFPGSHGEPPPGLSGGAGGVGSTYPWRSDLFGFRLGGGRFSTSVEGVLTREEYVPNERIVDHSSTGPTWTFTFQPDSTGTTVSLGFEYSTRVPLMDKVVDRVAWHGDRDLDETLQSLKAAIES